MSPGVGEFRSSHRAAGIAKVTVLGISGCERNGGVQTTLRSIFEYLVARREKRTFLIKRIKRSPGNVRMYTLHTNAPLLPKVVGVPL